MTLDIKLPGQNGLSLISTLRSDPRTSGLPIVVVSAGDDKGDLEFNHLPLCISDWIEKPIDEDRLTLSVRRAVAKLQSTKPRILHVEDDLDIQQVVSAIAGDVATFQFAGSLAQARRCLSEGLFDLVILDLALGEETGWGLMEDIENLVPRPPVIVFSAGNVGSHEPYQMEAVLVKSQASNDELLTAIQQALCLSGSDKVDVPHSDMVV